MNETNNSNAIRLTRDGSLLQNVIFFGSVFAVTSFLFYHQVSSEQPNLLGTRTFASDMPKHLQLCQEAFWKLTTTMGHPLFHLLVSAISSLTGLSISMTFIGLLSAATTANALVIYVILKKLLINIDLSNGILLIAVLALMTAGPLYLPYHTIYSGQGSPNVWHNPTLLAVKPLALGITFLVVRVSGQQHFKKAFYFFIIFLGIVSSLIKPSFIVILLPALWVFFLLRSQSRSFLNFLIIFSSCCTLALVWQATVTYGQISSSRIGFDFLGVWSLYSQNVILSAIRASAFPLALVLARPTCLGKNNYLLLASLLLFFGLLYWSCLAETGPRYRHGNFGWSYLIGLHIMFVFAMVEFLNWKTNRGNKNAFLFLLVILIWHVATGLLYCGIIWTGGSYMASNPVFPVCAGGMSSMAVTGFLAK